MFLSSEDRNTAASLACGFAPNSLVLIVFRFMQGAAAAVMAPQIISVIQMQFSAAARAKTLSAYGAVLCNGLRYQPMDASRAPPSHSMMVPVILGLVATRTRHSATSSG